MRADAEATSGEVRDRGAFGRRWFVPLGTVCRGCEYRLEGCEGSRCPECGATFAASAALGRIRALTERERAFVESVLKSTELPRLAELARPSVIERENAKVGLVVAALLAIALALRAVDTLPWGDPAALALRAAAALLLFVVPAFAVGTLAAWGVRRLRPPSCGQLREALSEDLAGGKASVFDLEAEHLMISPEPAGDRYAGCMSFWGTWSVLAMERDALAFLREVCPNGIGREVEVAVLSRSGLAFVVESRGERIPESVQTEFMPRRGVPHARPPSQLLADYTGRAWIASPQGRGVEKTPIVIP